ncbi:ATP-binding protein [Calothrix sp. PCC 7507]|uniref:ATP-binding protein n=1 Tax=Calothrix sp. PCC 7507 TaxID=99598 RepID=UPI00029EF964|nr:ATP-binding protein [Calothrix sp. PCC 7507]AFY36455.1 multi-sensor hybrid histidine kinase [Calothrix sp. PCC 7507]
MRSWLHSIFLSSLRTRLVFLVLLAVVPALGLIIYSASEQRRTATVEAQQNTLQLVRLAANNQRQVVESTRQLLTILAQLPIVRQGNSPECDRLLTDLLKQYPTYTAFDVLDAQGKNICHAIPNNSINLVDQASFQRAVKTRKFAVGDYQIVRGSKKATLNFAYPVIDKLGQVKVVLNATLDLAELNNLAAQVKLPPGSVLSVVNKQGRLLVRYPDSQKWVGTFLIKDAFEQMKLAQGEGTYEFTSLDGITRVFAFMPLGDDPLNPDAYIRVGLPVSTVLAKANKLLVRNLLWLGVVTVLALIAAWVGGDIFLLRQMKLLVETAQKLGAGELNARTGISNKSGELGQLAGAIDEMAAALQTREGAIAALNQDMKTLFDLIPIGILVAQDAEFRHITANPTFAEILGISPEDNVSYTPINTPRPDYKIFRNGKELRPNEFPLRYAAIHQVEIKGTEIDVIRGDGTVFNMFGYAAPLLDKQGKARGSVAAFVDISDRKQVEKRTRQLMNELQRSEEVLRASEERFQAFMAHSPACAWITDADGCIIYLSPTYYQTFQLTTQDAIGKNIFELYDAEIAQQSLENIRTAVITNQVIEAIEIAPRLDGTIGDFLVYKFPIANPSGETLVGGVAIDVTERRRAEEEREQLLIREQTAREAAEVANRMKDEFLAILSHELRTPLNPILGWTKLLRTRKLDDNKKAIALETIERNAVLQTQLIGDLLDISRILQGKLTLNISAVDLAATIAAAKDTVQLAAEAKEIQIHTEIAPLVKSCMGDSNRLQQVLWNLLTNAVKFTPAGGEVHIKLESVGTYAQIQVSDTGKGINPDFLPYVFDTFRQADSATTRQFGGLGLGLAIVRHIVEMHGGTVSVASLGEGQGATFTVQLPLMINTPEVKPNDTPVADTLDLSGFHILVVDDEEDTRELLVFIMEQCGAQVNAASSATQAWGLLQQLQPDVLVCDIAMPEKDGYTLIRELRASSQQSSQTPALALTAYAGEINQQQALTAGFQKHLAKPVDPDELVRAIASLVKIKSSPTSKPMGGVG